MTWLFGGWSGHVAFTRRRDVGKEAAEQNDDAHDDELSSHR
jgi:hypothetical protein